MSTRRFALLLSLTLSAALLLSGVVTAQARAFTSRGITSHATHANVTNLRHVHHPFRIAAARGTTAAQSAPALRLHHLHITTADRFAAAARAAVARQQGPRGSPAAARSALAAPLSTPDYFGTIPNYANSPLPKGPIGTIRVLSGGSGYTAGATVKISDISWGSGKGATAVAVVAHGVVTAIVVTAHGTGYTAPTVTITGKHGTGSDAAALAVLDSANASGGMRKFVDALPGLGSGAANDLGQYIPVAVPDTTTFAHSDYYEIALVQYQVQMSKDLPPTTARGYVQVETPANAAHSKHIALKYPDGSPILDGSGAQVYAVDTPQYMGPTIVAQRDRAVRVKFTDYLPPGAAGDLFLPVDTTLMGAGMGPLGAPGGNYTQNRATLHLHGGVTPWISDGTPHQWTTPVGESTTSYTRGASVAFVPDMWFDPVTHEVVAAGSPGATNDPGPGSLTFYYTNQQSARLMFYHDHSYGITRLNVYAGEAAPYILQDPVEQKLVKGGTIAGVTVKARTVPATQVPLVIQDKTFVPAAAQLANEDPTWDPAWGGKGSLWLPHVYMPNQNPADPSGVNAVGRWDYSAWVYPPLTGVANGPVANPLYGSAPGEPQFNPGTPNPSAVAESFMDTPLVNGTAYPFLDVKRKAYRFRILNACDDRTLNLQLYYAKSNARMWNADGTLNSGAAGEVPMVPAAAGTGLPATWPTDGRDGGVPSPNAAGPRMIQIGNEGGLLPAPAVLPNTPVGYEYNRRVITFANVSHHTLLLGPAERADVIIDFSSVPAGSKLILYNDAPAPMPGFDSRYDYFTGDGNQTAIGGAPNTIAGYGPDTRTVMQFRVSGPAAPAFSLPRLKTALTAAYGASQPKPIVPEAAYGPAFGKTYKNTYAGGVDTGLTFTPAGAASPVTLGFQDKALIEGFDMTYGRMNAQLGTGLPNTGPGGGAAIAYGYVDPAADIVKNTLSGTQIGAAGDGTQIWMIEHQGVDTHAIHFHLFNVQLINRVAVDGTLSPPDANELGWKETIRMNPGERVIVALRPTVPTLPWKLPDSIRPLDPTLPVGATFTTADGATVTNDMTDFGWEYVWHCHLLGHEENDMMRPMVFQVAPTAPSGLTATPLAGPSVALAWTNNATDPAATEFTVQRATDAGFTQDVTTFTLSGSNVTSYNDSSVAGATTYYYRVRAEDDAGYSTWAAAPSPAVVP